LQLALDGDPGTPPPGEWIVSRICEEFGCLPSQAVRELEDGDADLVFTILEYRSYARAKQTIDAAQSAADVTPTPMTTMVFAVQAELQARLGPQTR
jgi:hypothetical protein